MGDKTTAYTPKAGRPTLRTIAGETGFAVPTVSRALANDPRIAQSTRDKVSAAAKRLGYVPDRAAQRLRTGQTRVISLLLNTDHEFLGFTNELIGGITLALRGTDYTISITPDFVDSDRMATVEAILRNRTADGVIFTRTEPFDERVRLLMEAGFPFVTHGRTDFTTPHPWVDFDNAAFAHGAVRRLVERGRKRIAIIMPDARFTFAQHLRYGFMKAVRETGIDFEIPDDVHLDSPASEVSRHVQERCRLPDPPDAYICVGEVMALATLAGLDDAGMTPGDEVEVIAKRASPIADQFRPRMDTFFEDVRLTGRDIGRMLLAQLNGEPVETLHVLQAPEPDFRL